jgi:hypothetical protein
VIRRWADRGKVMTDRKSCENGMSCTQRGPTGCGQGDSASGVGCEYGGHGTGKRGESGEMGQALPGSSGILLKIWLDDIAI